MQWSNNQTQKPAKQWQTSIGSPGVIPAAFSTCSLQASGHHSYGCFPSFCCSAVFVTLDTQKAWRIRCATECSQKELCSSAWLSFHPQTPNGNGAEGSEGAKGCSNPCPHYTSSANFNTEWILNSRANSHLDGIRYLKVFYLLWGDTFLVLCQGIREKWCLQANKYLQ